LRFCICWQHAGDEQLPGWLTGEQFTVIDVPWQHSRGACWARSVIMDLWDGEDWYLQLDSHHRFAPGWDTRLLEQAAATGSPKPIVSAFPPAFTPGRAPDSGPLLTGFDRFDEDGIPLPIGLPCNGWQTGSTPRRSRFLSAAFLFAPGQFVEDVPYDPELYFHGEEAMLTLRAFTHGYDLHQPSDALLWHDYSRAGRRTHWEDHVCDRGVAVEWHERDAASRARIRRFLAEPFVGHYGLGAERTLAEYEAYAGISLRYRRAQEYTLRQLEPPNPPAAPDWAAKAAGG